MSTLFRSYIGFRMPSEMAPALLKAQMEIRRRTASEPIRWLSESEFVLTLVSLGECEVDTLHRVAEMIRPLCAAQPHIALDIAGFTGIPNAIQPKLVALAVGGDVGTISTLQEQMQNVLAPIIDPNEKSYPPHIVMGRLRTESSPVRTSVGQQMRHMKKDLIAQVLLNHLEIFASQADEGGISYRSLIQLPFGLS